MGLAAHGWITELSRSADQRPTSFSSLGTVSEFVSDRALAVGGRKKPAARVLPLTFLAQIPI